MGKIMNVKKVALLTAGGLAPCLSSSVGRLIEKYSEDKTPKRVELSYDLEKGYMDIEVKELIEYDEENESVFLRGSDSEPTENIDNYWNQEGVFENQSDQSF